MNLQILPQDLVFMIKWLHINTTRIVCEKNTFCCFVMGMETHTHENKREHVKQSSPFRCGSDIHFGNRPNVYTNYW